MKSPLFLLPILGCLIPHAAANDTAINDGANGPEPLGWRSGEESIIQMKSEHLAIHFGIKQTSVIARFHFLSHKTTGPAKQKLGFPDASRSGIDNNVSGPIRNLVTKVNGRIVPTEFVQGYYEEVRGTDGSVEYQKRPDPTAAVAEDSQLQRYAWHVIEVDFPVGEEVIVERSYDCPTGADSTNHALFIYETRTGGAWRGVIEKLTAEVSFEEDLRTDLVQLSPAHGWTWNEAKNLATLVWERFEPRTQEDRTYFQITTLDLQRIETMHREDPSNFVSPERAIQLWLNEVDTRKGIPE
jgi:hypothetical protein